MIRELVKLATHLDRRGLRKEADYLDAVIKKNAYGDNEIREFAAQLNQYLEASFNKKPPTKGDPWSFIGDAAQLLHPPTMKSRFPRLVIDKDDLDNFKRNNAGMLYMILKSVNEKGRGNDFEGEGGFRAQPQPDSVIKDLANNAMEMLFKNITHIWGGLINPTREEMEKRREELMSTGQ